MAGKKIRKAALRKQIWKGFNAHVRRAKLLKKGEAEGGEATPPGEEGSFEELGEAEGGEAAPEVHWPAVGVKVAVGIEHMMHVLRLGEAILRR